MTVKEKLILRHNKYIAYLQILAGLTISLMAAAVFKLLEISSELFGIFIINNFVVAIIIGAIGLYFFRKRLKKIETEVGDIKPNK
ncbi:MAG: hypothetical protein Q7S21_05470 [archaeon]|nr:hypothetical protein [archaeon]